MQNYKLNQKVRFTYTNKLNGEIVEGVGLITKIQQFNICWVENMPGTPPKFQTYYFMKIDYLTNAASMPPQRILFLHESQVKPFNVS